MNPILMTSKLFRDIFKKLGTKQPYNEELYNSKIQKFLDKNNFVINTIRANWLYILSFSPFAYQYIYPKYLKKEEETINETKKQTIAAYVSGNINIISRVYNDKEIMELFANDKQKTTELYNAFIYSIHFLKNILNNYSTYCPSVIKNTENLLKFKDIAREEVVKMVSFFTINVPDISSFGSVISTFENLPEELKTPKAEKILIERICSALESDPTYYSKKLIDEDKFKKFRFLPQIIEATKVGWIKLLENLMSKPTDIGDNGSTIITIFPGFLEYTCIPPEFKTDPRIMAIRERVKKQMVTFLNNNFKNVFNTTFGDSAILTPQQKQELEILINEFRDEDFMVSLYWKEKEKLKEYLPLKEKMSGNVTIKFIQDYSAIITGQDGQIKEPKNFAAGDIESVYVLKDMMNYIRVELKDGSIIDLLDKSSFEILP
jgi:hypothetical protein